MKKRQIYRPPSWQDVLSRAAANQLSWFLVGAAVACAVLALFGNCN